MRLILVRKECRNLLPTGISEQESRRCRRYGGGYSGLGGSRYYSGGTAEPRHEDLYWVLTCRSCHFAVSLALISNWILAVLMLHLRNL
jgi:hypothetical protein